MDLFPVVVVGYGIPIQCQVETGDFPGFGHAPPGSIPVETLLYGKGVGPRRGVRHAAAMITDSIRYILPFDKDDSPIHEISHIMDQARKKWDLALKDYLTQNQVSAARSKPGWLLLTNTVQTEEE